MAAYTSVQLWSAVFTQGYVLWLEEPDASLEVGRTNWSRLNFDIHQFNHV